MYTAPSLGGGGQLPNPNECNSTPTCEARGIYPHRKILMLMSGVAAYVFSTRVASPLPSPPLPFPPLPLTKLKFLVQDDVYSNIQQVALSQIDKCMLIHKNKQNSRQLDNLMLWTLTPPLPPQTSITLKINGE